MDPRRWLLLSVTAFAVLLQHSSALSPRIRAPQPQPNPRFGFDSVQRIAQQRANEPYRDHSGKLPDSLSKISYDDYRDIQFRADQALWRDQALFEVQFFHRGFAYDKRVNVNEVGDDGVLRAISYDPSQFEFGKGPPPRTCRRISASPGLRVHFPLQTPDYKDELIAFLGASYFRLLGRDQSYGASARGLAINVATTGGEEFPYFTRFLAGASGARAAHADDLRAARQPEPRPAPIASRSGRGRPARSRSRRRCMRARAWTSSASRH